MSHEVRAQSAFSVRKKLVYLFNHLIRKKPDALGEMDLPEGRTSRLLHHSIFSLTRRDNKKGICRVRRYSDKV